MFLKCYECTETTFGHLCYTPVGKMDKDLTNWSQKCKIYAIGSGLNNVARLIDKEKIFCIFILTYISFNLIYIKLIYHGFKHI